MNNNNTRVGGGKCQLDEGKWLMHVSSNSDNWVQILDQAKDIHILYFRKQQIFLITCRCFLYFVQTLHKSFSSMPCWLKKHRGRLLDVGAMLDDNDTQQYQIRS